MKPIVPPAAVGLLPGLLVAGCASPTVPVLPGRAAAPSFSWRPSAPSNRRTPAGQCLTLVVDQASDHGPGRALLPALRAEGTEAQEWSHGPVGPPALNFRMHEPEADGRTEISRSGILYDLPGRSVASFASLRPEGSDTAQFDPVIRRPVAPLVRLR